MKSSDIRMIAEVLAQCRAQGDVSVDYVIDKLGAAIEFEGVPGEDATHRRVLFDMHAKAPPTYRPKQY